ncbi:AtzE family amidohydrolase [Klebsiella pneumoniae]|uniref:AtzE family amidohydrolase n=1 Tax=Klebsiella pneumoniae TaxID=573 RepID=UPI000B41D545|nr:AtzE family amidohydrolase [Klebsiella pneumoniae]HDS8389503.1 AtzE family amidohydrolase [Klebsiella pneumoniae subsp. pneumoniae]MBK5827039.1 AtzE family amidohydrolase [Klebsiella pneumoniae]MCD5894229.1 AtzE family amidohydrolase [Klebsiella pneumoniae]MCH0809277.1 AtzE family amidohydrolase [Klebsiella pneumoniae]MCP6583863.1 AtzE family amidohydrolase [Klebsiella pneumoniae]
MTLQHFTIADLQRALHDGELSAREIARQTLDDIARVNPQINAWTEVTAQRMLAEADSIDALRREKRPLPPLAGIPYAVKNLFDVAGHTTLAGAELLSDRPPAASDSWAVRQLHSAGALLSGMLNMDAYAYGFTTENSHYGATRNPHDLSRIAGGSSGGSAAAVAAGLVHFSLGSDTNGSIRVPASLCGIFGLKPTFGRLSRSGSHPFVASLDHIGPFARRVADLAAVYDALQGRDPADDFQADKASERTGNLLERGLEGLRCARLGGYFTTWCDDDARAAVDRVAHALGADSELQFADAALARSAAFIISASEGGNQYLTDLHHSPERFEPHSRERLLAGAMIPSAWYLQAQRFRRHARQAMKSLFSQADVLIAPATPCSATPIGAEEMVINGQPLPVRASMGMLTQPISFLGLPVVTVPLRTASGKPIGLQLIAAPFNEQACLRAARALEAMGITDARVAESAA